MNFFIFFTEAGIRAADAPKPNLGLVLTDILLALIFFGVSFLMRTRFLRILCLCGTEICLFLACKLFFGEDSIITFIMSWVTAAVACGVTIAVVNRIDWNSLRGKRDL